MRPDQLALMFFGAAIIEDNLRCLPETVDFMKLIAAVHRQPVGFGHFLAVFERNARYIIDRVHEFFELFCTSYPGTNQKIRQICETHSVNPVSPLGIAVNKPLVTIDGMELYAIPKLILAYRTWIAIAAVNPLPLLLSPDLLFSEHNPDLILSPLPDYNVPVPKPEDLETFDVNSQQSLLYRAIQHAKERRTVEATSEISQCCLKLTENDDLSCLPRASIALAQIYDLLGMREESLLALNECIGGAKDLPDSSVMATAIALKAQVDSSTSGWNYAAGESQPHPIAAVRVALEKNDFAEAVETDPCVACAVFGEKCAQIAELLRVNERLLPIRVLDLVQSCEWKEAAELIANLDLRRIEVRAAAIAFAIAFCEATGNRNGAEIYADEFDDVMEIDLGHFGGLKPTIRSIATAFHTSASQAANGLPLDRPMVDRIRWMIESRSDEIRSRGFELCQKYCLFGLAPQIEHNEMPGSLDVEVLLADVARSFP